MGTLVAQQLHDSSCPSLSFSISFKQKEELSRQGQTVVFQLPGYKLILKRQARPLHWLWYYRKTGPQETSLIYTQKGKPHTKRQVPTATALSQDPNTIGKGGQGSRACPNALRKNYFPFSQEQNLNLIAQVQGGNLTPQSTLVMVTSPAVVPPTVHCLPFLLVSLTVLMSSKENKIKTNKNNKTQTLTRPFPSFYLILNISVLILGIFVHTLETPIPPPNFVQTLFPSRLVLPFSQAKWSRVFF